MQRQHDKHDKQRRLILRPFIWHNTKAAAEETIKQIYAARLCYNHQKASAHRWGMFSYSHVKTVIVHS